MADEPVPGIPLPAEAGPRKWDWALSLFAILGLVPIVAAMVLIVPEFERVFRQVKVQMPWPTLMIVELSQVTRQYLWLVGFGLILFVTDIGHWTGWKAKLARTLLPLIPILVGLWMFWALINPFMGCHLSIGPKKH